MKKAIIILVFSSIVLGGYSIASAQVSDAVNDIGGALNAAKKSLPLPENVPALNDASGIQSGILSGGLTQGFSGVWDSFNAWTSEKIGISLGEIVSTILSFFMWVLNLLVKIVQAVLNSIPQ